jgi:hypothetical protein
MKEKTMKKKRAMRSVLKKMIMLKRVKTMME